MTRAPLDSTYATIAEVMAANIGGSASLVGDPADIIVGTRAGISFNAFLVHQLVLVGAVLLTREVSLGPELEFLLACVLGTVGSFLLASLVVRIPGVSRFV